MTTTRRPRISPAPAWSFPRYDEGVLDNGLRVWAFHLPGQYVVSAGINLDLPLAAEPREREGIASITLHCLDEGTHSHPGSAYTERLENVGAVFTGAATLPGTQVGIATPVTGLADALPLLAEALTEPALADDDVARHVGLRRAELVQARANSSQLAGAVTPGTVFDAGSRASRPTGGTTATVSQVTPEAVRDFHARHYSPAGATLVLAGDFAGADPLALAETAFGGWTAPGVRAEHPAPEPTTRARRLIGREDAVQADLRLTAYGIDRIDPRWPSLQIACVAMGGAFQSRLNTVLREKRGYTYGVHMGAHPLRGAGYITVSGSFRTEVLAAAVTEAHSLLDVSRRPFTDGEVRRAVRYQTDTAPLRYATAPAVAQQALVLAANGLDPAFVDRNRQEQREVTAESATAAYQSLWPADPAMLVIGDPALASDLGLEAEPAPEL